MGGPERGREAVDEMDCAVAAAVADDGLDGRVGESPTDVGEAFGDGSGVFAGERFADIGADERFEVPGAEEVGGAEDVVHGCEIGRGDESDAVAGLEEGRLLDGRGDRMCHRLKGFFAARG